MDTRRPPAFVFKKHKIDCSHDWHNTVLPPAVRSWSNQRKPCLLSTSQRTRKGKTQQFIIRYQFLFFFSSCNISPFTSGIFSHCLPPPPNQPTQWREHRAKTHLWPLTAVTVTTCIASQALLTATVTTSNDLGPLTTCQRRPAHCLNCTDPSLEPGPRASYYWKEKDHIARQAGTHSQ